MRGSTTAASPEPTQEAPPAQARLLVWTPTEQIRGYRRAEASFPTATVKAELSTRPLRSAGAIHPNFVFYGRRGSIDDYMRANRVAGLLVLHNGTVVLERYGLGQQPQDRWMAFSIAKSVTSTLLGVAIKDGVIKSVDEPVTNYIPELKGSAYDGVTIAQVLKMRSGVRWNEDYEDPTSDVSRIVASMANNRGDSLIALMKSLPRAAPPGSQFLYSSGESNLIGLLVTRATGKGLAQFLSEKIWIPYGMERDAVWITDGGIEMGGACVNMTLRDYARFGAFILGGGRIGRKSILVDNWVRDSTRPYSQKVFGDIGYGYQWWPHGDGSFEALGIFGQSVYIDPRTSTIVVTLSAWPHADWEEGNARRAAFLDGVKSALRMPR